MCKNLRLSIIGTTIVVIAYHYKEGTRDRRVEYDAAISTQSILDMTDSSPVMESGWVGIEVQPTVMIC